MPPRALRGPERAHPPRELIQRADRVADRARPVAQLTCASEPSDMKQRRQPARRIAFRRHRRVRSYRAAARRSRAWSSTSSIPAPAGPESAAAVAPCRATIHASRSRHAGHERSTSQLAVSTVRAFACRAITSNTGWRSACRTCTLAAIALGPIPGRRRRQPLSVPWPSAPLPVVHSRFSSCFVSAGEVRVLRARVFSRRPLVVLKHSGRRPCCGLPVVTEQERTLSALVPAARRATLRGGLARRQLGPGRSGLRLAGCELCLACAQLLAG